MYTAKLAFLFSVWEYEYHKHESPICPPRPKLLMGRHCLHPCSTLVGTWPFVNSYLIVVTLGHKRCVLVMPGSRSVSPILLSAVVLGEDLAKTSGSVWCLEEMIICAFFSLTWIHLYLILTPHRALHILSAQSLVDWMGSSLQTNEPYPLPWG